MYVLVHVIIILVCKHAQLLERAPPTLPLFWSGMGFEVGRFQSDVDKGLLCPFCGQVLEDPVTGKCGHVFCRGCLQGAFTENYHECPTCQKDILSTSETMEVSDELMEKLGKLSLQCKSGCETVVGYNQLTEHLQKECIFRPVPCEHKGCTETTPFKDLESHMEKCDHRLVECKVCKVCLPRKDMSAHQAIKRCFEELNKRRMVKSAHRLSQELREHRIEMVQQRHLTEQAERALVRQHYFQGPRLKRAMSAGPVLMRSSIQSRVGSAVVVPHYSRNLRSAAIESCLDCTNRFTHGRQPSARRHSHVNVSQQIYPYSIIKIIYSIHTITL